jgi:hypothetical protein
MNQCWKEYLFAHFKKDEFYDLPDEVIRISPDGLGRFRSYNELQIDTADRCGAIASTTLSMLFKPKVIVEMGVNLGWTSLLLCRLNPDAVVYGIDNRSESEYRPLPVGFIPFAHNIRNFVLKNCNSWDFELPGQVDLCFIDADHFLPAVEKDTWRAWDNRNVEGDWCIAWDDYHVNNQDVFNTVNEFVNKVGYPLQKIASWYWIGSKTMTENDLAGITA